MKKARYVEHLRVHTVPEGDDGVTLILTSFGGSVYSYELDDDILDEVEEDMAYMRQSYKGLNETLVIGDNLTRMLYEHLKQYYEE